MSYIDSLSFLSGLIIGTFGVVVTLCIILGIVVFTIIGYWRIFSKMGEAGWKAFIPIYNTYILFKNCWEVKFFIVWIISTLIMNGSGSIQGDHRSFIISTVAGVANILVIVLTIMMRYQLSKAFGHGVGFTIGMMLIPPVFFLILGLGPDRYLGNPSQNTYSGYDDYNNY